MSAVKKPAPDFRRATTADLANVKSKAGLIDGRVVRLIQTVSGTEADVEPALPGWRIPLDRVFSRRACCAVINPLSFHRKASPCIDPIVTTSLWCFRRSWQECWPVC
jgi:hypothetical protein